MKCHRINCSAFLLLNGELEKFCVKEIETLLQDTVCALNWKGWERERERERESRETLLT